MPDVLSSLIEKLERATGPDRELDVEIGRMMGTLVMRQEDVGPREYTHWRYTESIDAAVSLIPEKHHWTVSGGIDEYGAPRGMEGMFSACCPPVPFEVEPRTWAKHPALALCIAALKAHAAKQRETENV